MKKFLTSMTLVLVMLTMILTTTACSNVPSKYQGTYSYSSTSYIVVNQSSCDYQRVYVGDVYYENGEYAGELVFSGTGLEFEAEEVSSGIYKVTAQKEYNNGTVTVTSYLYDNSGNPYIVLAGRVYRK